MQTHLAASSLVLGSPGWISMVLATGIFFSLLLVISVLKSPLPGRWAWGLFALKFLAVWLLVACLLDPQIVRRRAVPGENIVVLLADDSASMTIRRSADGEQTRADWALSLLDSNEDWQTRLAQGFDVQRYSYGSALARVGDFRELSCDAPASRLNSALKGLLGRYAQQPLAAIFLFSDGNSTQSFSEDLKDELHRAKVPIYVVVDESGASLPDVRIEDVSVSQTNFEDAPVTVQARIAFSGPRPENIVVTLRPQDPEESESILEQTVPVESREEVVVRLEAKPKRRGALFYQLTVKEAQTQDGLQSGDRNREATLRNNQCWVSVNRDPHVSRILYVGGRPNWEYKFLNRALSEDPQLQLPSLIRIARKEARFDFRGRVGETSNSLFRGFKSEADEETEDYSQPVLVRLNMRDSGELAGGFPKSKAELYEYDAIILDDVESEFFTHDQQSLIDRFVQERGGGLLMLGGVDTFRHGNWDNTPVADALPVYLNRPADGPSGQFSWQLTREGWLEPWLRLRETEQVERNRLQDVPELSIVNGVSQIKPGARQLVDVVDTSGHALPALVVQQYGRGRSGALLVGDLWKWSLQPDEQQREDAAQSWRQIVRWLVGDVPQRVETSVRALDDEPLPMQLIQVRVRDREFQPDEDRRVQVEIHSPSGSVETLEARPSLEEAGLFEVRSVSKEPGTYTARMTVSGDADHPPRTEEIGWTSDPAADEFRRTEINESFLHLLAEQSGGRVIPSSQLMEFVEQFPHQDFPVMETQSTPLWHQPWVLAAVLGLLAAEWGLRRRKGLA